MPDQQDRVPAPCRRQQRHLELLASVVCDAVFVADVAIKVPQMDLHALARDMWNQERQAITEPINPPCEATSPGRSLTDIACARTRLLDYGVDRRPVQLEIPMTQVKVICPGHDIEAA